MTSDAFFEAMRAWLLPRRAAVTEHFSIAFAVVDGRGWTIDTRAEDPVKPEYRAGCDVAVLCNRATIEAIAAGTLDLDQMRPHQLFRWGGDPQGLERWLRLLRGRSLLATRVTEAKRTRSKR